MHNKIENTYACKKAIPNSKTKNTIINIQGTIANIIFAANATITAPAIMCNNTCPANILANSRIDKLNGRKKNDMISINTNNGNNQFGIPLGTKIFKNDNPCSLNPIIINPIKNDKANVKVTAICAVTVKLNGTKPTKFNNKINKNILKINGK